jgi:hypothetical protein
MGRHLRQSGQFFNILGQRASPHATVFRSSRSNPSLAVSNSPLSAPNLVVRHSSTFEVEVKPINEWLRRAPIEQCSDAHEPTGETAQMHHGLDFGQTRRPAHCRRCVADNAHQPVPRPPCQ